MTYRARFEVKGVSKLLTKLGKLDEKQMTKVHKQAIRAGSRIIAKSARKNARKIKRTGLLAKAMAQKLRAYRKTRVVGIIGVKKGMKTAIGTWQSGKNKGQPKYADPAKYLHLVELGTKRSRAKEPLGRAVASTASQVRNTMAKIIAAGILRLTK